MQYRPLNKEQYYIDKTETLEKEIAGFPSIYIEGAAASGKTTAVRMLLERHPEIETEVFLMDEVMQAPEKFSELLIEPDLAKEVWVVLENIPGQMPEETVNSIVRLIRHLPEKCRVIMIGRERPAEGLLELYWKREMEILPQSELCFDLEEIRMLADYYESRLNPAEIYKVTGGWAGCVDVMLRLTGKNGSRKVQSGTVPVKPEELRSCYEVDTYIRRNILDTLSEDEREILRRGAVCPWLDDELCREVWNIGAAEGLLEKLTEKGFLVLDKVKKRWKLAALFEKSFGADQQNEGRMFWNRLGEWYGTHGCVREMLMCLKKSGDEEQLRETLKDCCTQVPFIEIPYDEVEKWKEISPEACYLRGMHCYSKQNLKGFEQEIHRLEVNKSENLIRWKESYLNLNYRKTDLTLEDWLALVEKYAGSEKSKDRQRIHLYGMMGKGFSFLCGARDLTGLFACSRKEENRKARIWKEYLGEEEWTAYRLARLEYYLETERADAVPADDLNLLKRIGAGEGSFSYQIQMGGIYLLCKLQRLQPEEERERQIECLKDELQQSEYMIYSVNAEAVVGIYAPWMKGQKRIALWLYEADKVKNSEMTEESIAVLFCRSKGCLFLNQYEKAGKILQKIVPYLQMFRRNRVLAEALFGQAIVSWNLGRHGQALRSVIESFIVNGNSRYVGFYTEYGKKGSEVLEAYVEWMKKNSPEGWHRKKKYNYGNVLRMPETDYMEVILRCAKREIKNLPQIPEQKREERLTMMETIILQDINRGLTNAQICEELNLKLPTVKSHIYSLYKKLGVNSRMQAVRRSKELGIIE